MRELVANFADERVGAVSGALILLDEKGRESSDGAGAYWRYEKALRAMESDIHSVPGATGPSMPCAVPCSRRCPRARFLTMLSCR